MHKRRGRKSLAQEYNLFKNQQQQKRQGVVKNSKIKNSKREKRKKKKIKINCLDFQKYNLQEQGENENLKKKYLLINLSLNLI